MKIIAGRFLMIVALLGIAGISCSKSDSYAGKPTIELIADEGFIAKDTAAYEADPLRFRVHCKYNGDHALTNLIVARNDVRVVDEGFYSKEFTKDIDFAKSSSELDSIVFTIRDIESSAASTSIKVQKKAGSGGGELKWYTNVTLDAQNAVGGKGFLSFANGLTYTKQEASAVAQNINLLYYYDAAGDANTIASPGANLAGLLDLSGWSVFNTTRYIKMSNLSQTQFEAITDPVYVVNAYNATGNRKAKNLVVGDTYSFKDESTGKYGIFRVNSVVGQDAGKVVISIVMQK